MLTVYNLIFSVYYSVTFPLVRGHKPVEKCVWSEGGGGKERERGREEEREGGEGEEGG